MGGISKKGSPSINNRTLNNISETYLRARRRNGRRRRRRCHHRCCRGAATGARARAEKSVFFSNPPSSDSRVFGCSGVRGRGCLDRPLTPSLLQTKVFKAATAAFMSFAVAKARPQRPFHDHCPRLRTTSVPNRRSRHHASGDPFATSSSVDPVPLGRLS